VKLRHLYLDPDMAQEVWLWSTIH